MQDPETQGNLLEIMFPINKTVLQKT